MPPCSHTFATAAEGAAQPAVQELQLPSVIGLPIEVGSTADTQAGPHEDDLRERARFIGGM